MARLSVVALALVDLREKSRLEPDWPAEAAGLPPLYLRVLRHQSRRPMDTVRPYTWLWPRWVGTRAVRGTAHPAGKPSGSTAGA